MSDQPVGIVELQAVHGLKVIEAADRTVVSDDLLNWTLPGFNVGAGLLTIDAVNGRWTYKLTERDDEQGTWQAQLIDHRPVMRRFELRRDTDLTGVSGVGRVAEGVQFGDGRVALRWCAGDHRSTVVWDSIDDVERIHGHDGATVVEWID